MNDEEYNKELAKIREQFNKLKMMIEENQRYGWIMKKKVKWQRLQQKREQQMNMQLVEELRKLEQVMSVQLGCEELREAELKMEISICEAKKGEIPSEAEDWRSVKDLMNYCEDSRQQDVYLAEKGITDDFLNCWASSDQRNDVKHCIF